MIKHKMIQASKVLMPIDTSKEGGSAVNIVICEDDTEFAKELAHTVFTLLNLRGTASEIVRFASGSAFLKSLGKPDSEPDLIFMDIQLGDSDGVNVVKKLRDHGMKTPVIFLTGLEDRIAEGYDVNAYNYLFKRTWTEKLPSVLDRFINEVYNGRTIAVKSKGSVIMLKASDIYYADADKRNTSVHTEKEIHTDATAIQTFSLQLPSDCFVEVYHALFVNVDHVSRVDSDSLLLDNNETVPVSRRKRKELMSAIMRRVRSK